MEHVLPAGKVFQAGTLSGNPLATAAGIATLRAAARSSRRTSGWSSSARGWRAGLRRGREQAGVPHTIARVGSMLTLFFNAGPITDWRDGEPVRHGAVRQLLLGPDRPRRLYAVQPVRGAVRLGGPHAKPTSTRRSPRRAR